MATKANLKQIPVEHYVVSSSEEAEHLQNQLGFPIDCDFRLLDNRGPFEKPMATEKCYVVMRVVIRPDDIRVKGKSEGYVDQVLKETAAGMMYKDDILEILKPFMFPADIVRVHQMPEKEAQLAAMGLCGEPLEKIIRRPSLFYDQVTDRFGIYLCPEKIIGDMCKDPDTDAINGYISFGYVSGDNMNAAAIQWGVNVYHSSIIGVKGMNGVTIDAVFNNATR